MHKDILLDALMLKEECVLFVNWNLTASVPSRDLPTSGSNLPQHLTRRERKLNACFNLECIHTRHAYIPRLTLKLALNKCLQKNEI